MGYPSNILAVYSFEDNLTDSTGQASDATVTGSTTYTTNGAFDGSKAITTASPANGAYVDFPLALINTTEGAVEFVFTTSTDVSGVQIVMWLGGSGVGGSRTLEWKYVNGNLSINFNGSDNNFLASIATSTSYYARLTWYSNGFIAFLGDVSGSTISNVRPVLARSTAPSWGTVDRNRAFNNFNGLDLWKGAGLDWVVYSNIFLPSDETTNLVIPPTGLATGTPTATTIPLTWTDPAINQFTHFYTNTVDDSSTATEALFIPDGDQAGTIVGLNSSTLYYIFAKTVTEYGQVSDFGSSVSATTASGAITYPDAPTALTVTSQSSTAVALSWTNGDNTTKVDIMRAEISDAGVIGAWTAVNDATVTGTTYTDNSANSTPDPVAGTYYRYAIKPYNGTDPGDWSNTVGAGFVDAVTRIPGDFEADLADAFFNTGEFAESVTYTVFGGSPVTIKAMYDAETGTVDPITGEVRSTDTLIWCATKDTPNASNRDTFVISGVTFRVTDVLPDGSGVSEIHLTKDS